MEHLYYSTEKLYGDYDFHLPERFNPDFDSFTLAPIGKPAKEKLPLKVVRKQKAKERALVHAKEVLIDMLSDGAVDKLDAIKRLESEGVDPVIGNEAVKALGVEAWRRYWEL